MNIDETQNQLIEEFAPFDDWLDKYEKIIEYGDQMPMMDDKYKTEEHSISGCQSKLWIISEIVDGKIIYYADSNSKIVRGIVAVVLKVVNHQSPEEVANADLYFLDEIGLAKHLSPVRANGLASVVKKIKEFANEYMVQ